MSLKRDESGVPFFEESPRPSIAPQWASWLLAIALGLVGVAILIAELMGDRQLSTVLLGISYLALAFIVYPKTAISLWLKIIIGCLAGIFIL